MFQLVLQGKVRDKMKVGFDMQHSKWTKGDEYAITKGYDILLQAKIVQN